MGNNATIKTDTYVNNIHTTINCFIVFPLPKNNFKKISKNKKETPYENDIPMVR